MSGQRVCIFGSREGVDPRVVVDYVKSLPEGTEVVVGGGRGVDTVAEGAARARRLTVKVFRADWSKHGKPSGPIRNQQMADYADRGRGFRVPRDQKSDGTDDMERRLERAGKPVEVTPVP